MRRTWALAGAAWLGASGCAAAGAPAVELGTGTTAFAPLAEGDEVAIVQGPQGGYHLDGSVRATGVDCGDPDDLASPRNPTTVFRVFLGEQPVSGVRAEPGVSYTQGLDVSSDPQFCEMVGRRVYLNITRDDDLVGQTLRVEVTLTDASGVTVADDREVFAVAHPANTR